jgi:hypothetical protein
MRANMARAALRVFPQEITAVKNKLSNSAHEVGARQFLVAQRTSEIRIY